MKGTTSVLGMIDDGEEPSKTLRERLTLLLRGPWIWVLYGTLVAIVALWAGTQIALESGQDVAWYSGFGQWLGALGSMIAAGVALWIATSERQAAQEARDRDLAREAGLVTVRVFDEMRVPGAGATDVAPGIVVMNWRQSRLFNLHIREIRGAVSPFIVAVRTDPGAKLQPALGAKRVSMGELMLTPIAHEDVVTIFPTVSEGGRISYASLRYTDETGRQWEVDNGSRVARIVL
ncbi:Uncharacterised protein [Prescottella equi]|nr:putative membrane protein [Prescottella equi]ARX59115.1 putative membrane protein [Prescottella equi]ARX59197.1 putative membrane protein [Prescottella equi]ARX59292.1 putative membrane protein [Prescottella equi]ARX59348.1 putative membrane protein [Prescottella equi]